MIGLGFPGLLIGVDAFHPGDGGATYSVTPMANTAGDTHCGAIPSQPIGTTICYFVEAEDDLGNIETNPLSFPMGLHCFQVQGIPDFSASILEGDLNFVLLPEGKEVRTLVLENIGTWPADWSITDNPQEAVLTLPAIESRVHWDDEG